MVIMMERDLATHPHVHADGVAASNGGVYHGEQLPQRPPAVPGLGQGRGHDADVRIALLVSWPHKVRKKEEGHAAEGLMEIGAAPGVAQHQVRVLVGVEQPHHVVHLEFPHLCACQRREVESLVEEEGHRRQAGFAAPVPGRNVGLEHKVQHWMHGLRVVLVDRKCAAEAQGQQKAVYVGEQVVAEPVLDVDDDPFGLLVGPRHGFAPGAILRGVVVQHLKGRVATAELAPTRDAAVCTPSADGLCEKVESRAQLLRRVSLAVSAVSIMRDALASPRREALSRPSATGAAGLRLHRRLPDDERRTEEHAKRAPTLHCV